MATDELMAAAERYRKGWYCHDPKGMRLWREDVERLAAAYLVEHPADDGELSTDEFLASIGGKWIEKQAAYQFLMGSRQEVLIRSNGSWWGFDHGTFGGRFCGQAKVLTRGDVRRLCAALAIPLKAETETE